MNKKTDYRKSISLERESTLPKKSEQIQSQSYEVIKIYPDKLVLHRESNFKSKHIKVPEKCILNLKKKQFNGVISHATKSVIKAKLITWFETMKQHNGSLKYKSRSNQRIPVLVTVTLSQAQMHTDNELKRELLMRFIEKLRYHYSVEHYFWKAETQLNGNIHFHIIIDRFIHYDAISKIWNAIQEKKGYIDEYRFMNGHNQPPSTDVRAGENPERLADYLITYALKDANEGSKIAMTNENITKSKRIDAINKVEYREYDIGTRRRVDGRLWGMSDKLREIEAFTDTIDTSMIQAINELIKSKKFKVHSDTYFTIIYCTPADLYKHMGDWHSFIYERYYKLLYGYLYEGKFKTMRDVLDELFRPWFPVIKDVDRIDIIQVVKDVHPIQLELSI